MKKGFIIIIIIIYFYYGPISCFLCIEYNILSTTVKTVLKTTPWYLNKIKLIKLSLSGGLFVYFGNELKISKKKFDVYILLKRHNYLSFAYSYYLLYYAMA